MAAAPALIALDWGTTSLRAYLLGADGAVLQSAEHPLGILQVKDGDFAGAFRAVTRQWRTGQPALPALTSGMIGSRQGWREAPYVECPAGLDEVARGLIKIEGETLAIVPGVNIVDADFVPDVMRGEEAQIFGAFADGRSAIAVLPGTHSKWVEVENGRILRFTTHMTGEAFAMLKTHSILGRMMTDEASDTVAFEDGIRRSGDANGLLNHLFGVRARGLFGEISERSSPSYLSGILIGHEIRAARRSARTVKLLGSTQLAATYARAFKVLDIPCSTLSSDAAAIALFKLAKHRRA